MRPGILIILAALLFSSTLALRWTPPVAITLADYAPQGSVLYFEVAPKSMLLADGERLAQFGQDQQWLGNAMARMPAEQRPRVQQLLSDSSTRVALSVARLQTARSGGTRLDFLLLAQASRERFPDLVAVGEKWLQAALPPGRAVEMQSFPRLGALIGEPPRRLYFYEDFPLYAVSNNPALISRLLEVRYKNLPSQAEETEFLNARQALANSGGAFLYVNLRRLKPDPSDSLLSPFTILQALNITDWAILAYGWEDVRGEIVRRTILIKQ